jgi:hypothetical protein
MASKALLLLLMMHVLTPADGQTTLTTSLFYSFGTAAGDTQAPPADDSFSAVTCSIGFPFYGNSTSSLFVSLI